MVNKVFKSIIAGMAIALAGCIYLCSPNPIIGAFLFTCGLLCVRIYNLNLFTGKMQYMITKEYKWYDYFIFLIGNLVGVLLIGSMTLTLVKDAVAPIAAAKASQPFITAMVKGFGCGALMSLATYKNSPLWMCFPCVMGFILAGFNHCIADAYYLLTGLTVSWSFLASILGNIIGGVALRNFVCKEQT